MASDLNTRLAAILDMHPKLRPTCSEGTPLYLRLDESAWRWVRPESLVEEDVDDAAAHALLFRAMVEPLPVGYVLERYGGCWIVKDTVDITAGTGDTALDALINFYEGADHAG